ncbi:MAG: STAS domain-containing protein [Rhodococcus sp.]|uniref:SulP family inorganic anion transporter n=1 Tax=Rhodococcus sp. TaxID=1831 RepID=UPI0016B37914|nr:SulP family inorganic anion transporter [Rhodococcus sp. (in: high G+C Gram-positive bacteria)]NLV80357.1 STAS domain-containing protein [Rhodococcus sp. (in: high G+C Gram-positive bacteria)]
MSAPALLGRLPGVVTARGYRRAWLRHDLVAGLTLSALLVPTGMGYAQAAGLPAQAGLYATIVPMLVYAFVGPSRILVLGPDSALAPLIAAAVVPLAAGGDPQRAVALAGALAVLVGLILLVAGALRLGFVTDLLSTPIRVGFLNAIALIVVVGQLPLVFGTSADESGVLPEFVDVVDDVFEDGPHLLAMSLGITTLVVIAVFRRFAPRFPGVLVAVVGGIAVTAAFGLRDRLDTVGALTPGLPAPALHGIDATDVGALVGPAVAIAVIAFADTAVLSRSLAARRGEHVDGSAEMRALGAVNVAAGVTGGFAVCGSGSRTPVVEQSGGRTQLAGVVAASTVVLFLWVAPGVTAYLPQAVLGAVVIAAAASLIDIRGVAHLWTVSRLEFALCLAAFVGVAFAGVLRGVLVAIGLSLLVVVVRAWQPHRTELVAVSGVAGYHDIERHPDGNRIDGLILVRFDAPLFFANGSILTSYVRGLVERSSAPVEWVVLAAEPITDVDSTAVDDLEELDDYLSRRDVHLVFAAMKGPVKDKLRRMAESDRFDDSRFHPTVRTAVVAFRYRNDHDVDRRVVDAPPPDIVDGRDRRPDESES